jgi:diacylglycerol kinase (ATP)
MTVASRTARGAGPSKTLRGSGVRTTLAKSLIIISTGAGSVTPEVEKELRTAFYGDLVLDFNPKDDFRKLIAPDARVVVAGGDGTIGFVARALIDSHHTLGIISLGTFNNFAKSLGLPADLKAAIKVVKTGVPRPITVGRVNDTPFLEAAAIGMFGAAIELGEAVKDGAFGELGRKLGLVTGAKPFRYEIDGDIQGHGRALSLVFANTPSIGASMPVANATPIDHNLDLAVHAGASRRDIIGRLLSGRMTTPREEPLEMGFRFKKITVTTKPAVEIFADNSKVGRTPATISAELGALNVILPKTVRPPRR